MPQLQVVILLFVAATASSASNVTFGCLPGWNLIGSHCYNFVNVSLDFEDAVDTCHKYGASLMVVRDEVEAKDISSLAGSRFIADHYWIYNGKSEQEVYNKTGNSTSLNSTFCSGMWQPNEPRETVDDVAVASNIHGRWAVMWVWMNLPFVCRTPACPVDSYRCSNGMCLNSKWVCDGVFDCGDHSDENNCTDNVRYYKSSSGTFDTTNLPVSDYYKFTIEGQPGEILRVELEAPLKIADNADSVKVYSGGPSITTSTLIREIRTSQFQKITVYGTNNFLIVTLQSGSTGFKPSVKASWISDPVVSRKRTETVIVTNTSQVISSPHFDSSLMPGSFKMEWLLRASEGEIIVLEVLNSTFEIQTTSDVYIVRNVGFMLNQLNSNKTVYISSKNNMTIILKTNSGNYFSAHVRTGCDFATQLSLATFSIMNLPANLTCMWMVTNELGTGIRVRTDKVYFDDSNDYLELSPNTDMNSTMTPATLSSTSSVSLDVDIPYYVVTFKYSSDNVRPSNMIGGRISADCLDISNKNNMNVTYSNRSQKNLTYSAQIRCEDGYSFKQEEYRMNMTLLAICNEVGIWDWGSPSFTRIPTCQIVYCGFPPQIPNGYVKDVEGNVTYKTIATYQCFSGFEIKGSPNVTCQASGYWSQTPSCEAEKCEQVPTVGNATYNFTLGDGSNLSSGTVVKYVCDTGYELLGSQQIVCRSNKTWSPESPSCKKLTCPLPIIQHGQYRSTSAKLPYFGETVGLFCDSGFQINGTSTQNNASVVCSFNRKLSPEYDACVDINECNSTSLNNCSSTQDCINKNGSYTCVCKSGYNGTDCSDVNECAQGMCHQSCTNLLGSYSCSCYEGYTLYTANGTNGFYIPAGENGLKPGDVYQINSTCVPVMCKKGPEPPIHGKALAVKPTYYYNESVNVICDFGYMLENSSVATCQSDGNWTYSNTPTCKKMSCPQPNVSEHEVSRTPAIGDIEPGAALTITCKLDDGSGKFVNKSLFCAPSPSIDGVFVLQGDNPACPEVNCGSPLNISGGNPPNVKDTTYGSLFEFTCDNIRGFKVAGASTLGNATVVCQSNGRWGYANLTCQGARCKDPGTLAGTVQIVKTSYEIDQVVQYNCTRPGFTPVTNDTLVCEFRNGKAQWNRDPPSCEDKVPPVITCPTVEPLDLYSTLVYPQPTVRDNSGITCFLVESGPPSGASLVSNNVTVRYKATDTRNDAFCEFNITVKDRTEPTIQCPSVIQRDLAGRRSELFNLTEALLVSHSGDGMIMFDPRGPLNLTMGTIISVRANITKANGLSKECAFLVSAVSTVCMNDSLIPPENGRVEQCTGNMSSLICKLVCDKGYLFQTTYNSTSFSCINGTWETKFPVLPCIKLLGPTFDFEVTLQYIFNGNKILQSANYDPNICLAQHASSLSQLVQTKTACGYSNFTVANVRRIREISSTSDELFFTLQLLTTAAGNDSLGMCAGTLKNQSEDLFGPTYPVSGNRSCFSPWTVNPTSVSVVTRNMSCSSNSTIVNYNGIKYCLPCGAGTFFNVNKCEECPDGLYQDETGQAACKQCPNGILRKSSHKPRTRMSHCFALCPEGFTSASGYIEDNCTACPVNHFSKSPILCQPCPNNGSTLGISGAKSVAQCSEPCAAGEFSITGYKPCSICPHNFYNDKEAARMCMECPSETYTVGNGTKSSSDCLNGSSMCTANFCNTVGAVSINSCKIRYHRPMCVCKPGYYGDSCNKSCDICNPNPCYNEGTCTASGLNFTCTCKIDTTCAFDRNQKIKYTSNLTEAFASTAGNDKCRELCLKNDSCVAYLYEKPQSCYQYSRIILDTTDNVHESYVKNCSVKQLFEGPLCEKDLINNCNDSVCTSIDFCMDLVGGTKCQCPHVGTYDSRCANPDNLCLGNNCNLHGNCISYGPVRSLCVCDPGYTGDSCETNINECAVNTHGCLYNGTCQDGSNTYSCSCVNGFSGSHCEVLADFCSRSDCKVADGGICTNNFHNYTASCTCGGHYMLDPLKSDVCVPIKYCVSNPCVNGTCTDLSGGFRCDCTAGFEGSRCQHNIDNCINNTCKNGAKCVDGINNHDCECLSGFRGPFCEENIDDCAGKCVPENTNTQLPCQDLVDDYQCFCKPGFTGKNCSENIDECLVQEPCRHGGNCSDTIGDYNCACPVGYTGNNCELEENNCESPDTCMNKGTCYNLANGYYCKCQDGTAGANCEQMEQLCNKFKHSACSSNGKCELFAGTIRCQCLGESKCTFSRYYDLEYSTTAPVVDYSANSRSQCEQLCLQNTDCVAYLSEKDKFCLQYKKLLNGTNEFESYVKSCTTKSSYSGVACELEKNHCADNPCNGGQCILSNLTYICNCSNVKNYGGRNCNEKNVVCNACPNTTTCMEFEDELGYLRPACLCSPNSTLVGNVCKVVDRDYDLAFLESFANKGTFITSERGFYLGNKTSLSISMWLAAAKQLDNNKFILALRSSKKNSPFLSVFNREVQFMTDVNISLELIEDTGVKHSLDESFFWHFLSIAWMANGSVVIVFDYLTLNKTTVSVVPPSEEFVFVQLGQSFYGYISQVSVWKTALTQLEQLEVYNDKLAVPQPDNLLLGWTQYSFDSAVKKTKSSTAVEYFSVCNITDTIVKKPLDSQDCKNKPFTDKTPPQVNYCNESAVLPTDYSKHQVSSSQLGYEFTDDTDGKLMAPAKHFLSFGAYDIAVTAMDKQGNIGVCMTRAFITPNKCSDTEPSQNNTKQCSNNSDGRQVSCPDGMLPSVPTPKFVMCGKLLTYNLDNMYEQPDRIVCGVKIPRSVAVMMMLTYVLQVDCNPSVLTSVSNTIKTRIDDLNTSWPGVCSDKNCSNLNISAVCSGFRMVNVSIQINSLNESLNSTAEMQTLTPLELMRKTVADKTTFDIQKTIGGGQLMNNMTQINTVPSCAFGYSLSGVYCVQCGPGSFYHEGERQCKLCELSTYSNQSGSNRCTNCPDNHVTFQKGSADSNDCRKNCSIGHMLNTTSDECVPCPRNFYQNQTGKHYCFPCPPISGTENTASSSLTQCIAFCQPGTELKGQDCVDCQRGFYRPGNLQDPCSECPLSNFTTKGNGSMLETECNIPKCSPGNFVYGNVCKPCDYGTYQPNEAEFQCIPCGTNYTTENITSANASMCRFICPAGHEERPAFSQQCMPCHRGYYHSDAFDQRFENCTMCPDGFTTMTNGSNNITDCRIPICMAGMYLNMTEGKCSKCPANFYQNETLQESCQPCPNNTQTQQDGASSLDNCTFVCPPGYEVNNNTNRCKLCPRGTYKDESLKFERCKNCSSNVTTDSEGAMNVTMCNVAICSKGYIVSADNTTCVKCPMGTYQDMEMPFSTTICQLCPQNTSTQAEASTSLNDCKVACEPGFGVTAGKCEPCQRGTWNSGNVTLRFQECQKCPVNFTTDVIEKATDIINCSLRDCGPGTYFDNATVDCLPCQKGFYQNQSLQNDCMMCPVNTSTRNSGSTTQEDCTIYCPAGEGGETGTCLTCGEDQFKEKADFGPCLNCTGELTSTASNRTFCSEIFCYKGRELKDGNCSDCQIGFYKSSRGNMSCTKCPVNTTTSGNRSTSADDCSLTYCDPGFFSSDNKNCTACPTGFYKNESGIQNCTECPRNVTTDGVGKTNASDCYLAVCQKGYFRNSSNVCEICSIGFYQDLEGQTSCKKCNADYTTLQTGAVTENDCRIVCQAGSYRNDSTNKCLRCPIGSFQGMPGKNECIPCLENYTTEAEGSVQQDQCLVICPEGHYRSSAVQCSPCPVGQYQNETGQSRCKSCGIVNGYEGSTVSTASKFESDCLPICSEGVYLNKSSRSCVPCSIGYYKNKKNFDTECTPCSGDNTTVGEGEASCLLKICGKGYYRRRNSRDCILCPVGQFQDTMKDVFECNPCKDSKTTLIEGSPAENYCVKNCPPGEEYKPSTTRCVQCPTSQYRPVNALAPPTCIYCPIGQTTLGRGGTNCINGLSEGRPSRITHVSVNVTFIVKECGNKLVLSGAIKEIIRVLIQNQSDRRFYNLCSKSCESRITTTVHSICGTSMRKRRQTRETALATVTVNNVEPFLTNNTRNVTRSTIAVIEEAFYDTEPVQNYLNTYQLALGLAPAVDCGEQCVIDIEGNPQYCKPGQFAGTNMCEPCPKGNYSSFPVSKSCVSCPEGQGTEKTGADSIDLCDGRCAFEANYCGEGTCTTDNTGKHFCLCKSGQSGLACEQREPTADANVKVVAGVTAGVGGVMSTLLGVFGIVAYMKNKALQKLKEKAEETANNVTQASGSEASNKFPIFAHPMIMADPAMYGREVMADPTMYSREVIPDPTMYGREVIEMAR